MIRNFFRYHNELVRELRSNKGQILRASVEYIQILKRDADKNRLADQERATLEQRNRQYLVRIQVTAHLHVFVSIEDLPPVAARHKGLMGLCPTTYLHESGII